MIGEEERDRLESHWNQKFRRGGAGRILVGETGLKVQLAAMAEMGKTKEDIANAFHVQLAFLTTQRNVANPQAAETSTYPSRSIRPCSSATKSSTISWSRSTTRRAGSFWRPKTRLHVAFAGGMGDSQFVLDPTVTFNHDNTKPPFGQSLWRKFVKDGDTRGIKAKTVNLPMPASWPAGECCEPAKVLAQIPDGLLNAKSIDWPLTKAHFADVKEPRKNNSREGSLVVQKWLLIEYAVGTIPVVEVVSKREGHLGERLAVAPGGVTRMRAVQDSRFKLFSAFVFTSCLPRRAKHCWSRTFLPSVVSLTPLG